MSGGSMDYLCYKVMDANFAENTPERKAFRKHLDKVGEALKDIEWVDSGDNAKGDENEAIMEVLNSKAGVIDELMIEAKALIANLKKYIGE